VVFDLNTYENLVEELARLTPEELKNVLITLEKRLEKKNQLELAKKIIEKYRTALEELAK
jgi:hypothetical protein